MEAENLIATRNLEETIRYYNELIPEVYPNGFPQNFRLSPSGLIITSEAVNRPKVDTKINGIQTRVRQIGALDLEFLNNELIDSVRSGDLDLNANYPCGLNCPGCFSQDEVYSDKDRLMKWQEVMEVIDDLKDIGLSEVKFLGPGELFQNPDLFDILDALRERRMPISIFTKGVELGEDHYAEKIFGEKYEIKTAKELINKIREYDNINILLGFNSFFPQRQNGLVGSSKIKEEGYFVNEQGVFENRGVPDYTKIRNQALVNLVDAGYNLPGNRQRLTLIATPAQYNQIDELAEMYIWGAKRNIPVVIAPTMESGPKSLKLREVNSKKDPKHEKIIEMFTSIYVKSIELGITTLEKLNTEGISPYIGIEPCNQVANGLMLRLNGDVQICPGSRRYYGNVHETSIKEIWVNSDNYSLGPLMNNWCLAKKQGLPIEVHDEVLKRLNLKYSAKKKK